MSLSPRFIIPLICAIWLAPLADVSAAEHTRETALAPASPLSVIISPEGARIETSENVRARKNGAETVLSVVAPRDSSNLNISVPGRTIIRWLSTPVSLKSSSGHATRRDALVAERDRLTANIETAVARIDSLKAGARISSAQELDNLQALIQRQMPALAEEVARLKATLKEVDGELAELPGSSGVGQRIDIVLADELREGEIVRVDYSYDVASCGWTPIYNFYANPDTDKNNLVNVELLAEVWQYTGLDWTNARVTLVTRGEGPREPRPLRRWFVRNEEEKPAALEAAPVARASRARGALAAKREISADEAANFARPTADADNLYAAWTLAARGLPEGRSRMLITADSWRAPLQWLCRPTKSDNNVWIMAKYTLPTDKAWPAGVAQYNLEGQNIGEGSFQPRGGVATLYFGADPRVTVNMVVDSDKQGETGFINTSKTWTGAWTFTLNNEHSIPIKVRVERPEPILGNDNITVTYKDKPKAQIDAKEHALVWIADVPAHGKAVIEQGVTISSPVKLPLLPDVP